MVLAIGTCVQTPADLHLKDALKETAEIHPIDPWLNSSPLLLLLSAVRAAEEPTLSLTDLKKYAPKNSWKKVEEKSNFRANQIEGSTLCIYRVYQDGKLVQQ